MMKKLYAGNVGSLLSPAGRALVAAAARMPDTDLFGPKPKKPRHVMMHAVDTGNAPGLLEGWRTTAGAHFVCGKCGRDDGWSFDMTPSEVRRGLPCPNCN